MPTVTVTTFALHHDGDAYLISNTLTSSIPRSLMIAIADSLTRYPGSAAPRP